MAIIACILPLLLMDGADAGYSIFSVSAYDDSSGVPPWGVMASGEHTREGVCACGTGYVFGTTFLLANGDAYMCQDRGGLIRDQNIDLWRSTKQEALRWGRRSMRVLWVK
jgi:3D (Asp-Asp-Asp) domain-containing protein